MSPLARVRALAESVRTTFATKLLAAGITLALVLIGSVATFLLVNQTRETQDAETKNAESRAALLSQLVQAITAQETDAAAADLSHLAVMQHALADKDPVKAVAALTSPGAHITVQLPNETIAVFARDGTALYQDKRGGAPLDAHLPTVRSALAGNIGKGVEFVGSDALYDAAYPVRDGAGNVLGAVMYSAPLSVALHTFAGVLAYPTVLVAAPAGTSMLREPVDAHGQGMPAATPTEITASLRQGAPFDATYPDAQGVQVSASFIPVLAADQQTVAAFVGVELPSSPYLDQARKALLTVAGIALTALIVTSVGVYLFVFRFVRRPVARLERGVTRIAGGDYTSDVPVMSRDELGRLAVSVNRMRAQIASYIRRINASVSQLSDVSRALTTTTAGVTTLQRAVTNAAVNIAGAESGAALLLRTDGGVLEARAIAGHIDPHIILNDPEAVATLTGGEPTRRLAPSGATMLAVPMFYQGQVVGALAVSRRTAGAETDEGALRALANNAAIALENTKLFEREKETVRRLRELDSMKSDFLSTVQHELRTPVMAIMGQIELMTVAWDQWDELTKRDLLKDMEIYTRQLNEIVETMIDFSLLSSENVAIAPVPTSLAQSVDEVVAEFTDRHKGALPVALTTDIPSEARLHADPKRLQQIIAALLDNSVKFNKPGGHVSITASPDGGNRWAIAVLDDGIGIPAEALPHIFEQFYQVDNSKTRTHGGMGMGLALVDRFAAAHDATIDVESALERGTRVTLHWPAAVGEAPVSDGFHVVHPARSV